MNPILIIGGIIALIAFVKKSVPIVQSKASQTLSTVGTPSSTSSTPIPTPSGNSPNATPPFFQQSNSATPSEPVTTQSFDPINISSPNKGTENRQGTIADSVRTPTLHNNYIFNNLLNEKLTLLQRPISKEFIPETELTSISEEQYYGYENNTPNVPEVERIFGSANIKNSGGSNGTFPATPHAGILQYAHRLAPLTPKNTRLEKVVPEVSNRLIKSSLKPSGKVTHPNPNFFKPVDKVR